MSSWVLVLLLPAAVSLAEGPLTLAQAQAEARAHAPEGAELDARVRGAEAAVAPASRALRSNPELSASWAPGALVGNPEEWAADLGLSQTFDLSGSWAARGRSAEAEVERARELREDGLRALGEAVAIAVANLAVAQRQAVRAERIAALAQVALDGARRQLEVGQGTQLDVDAAQLDAAGARAEIARARGAAARGRAKLARLLGRASPDGLAVADEPETPSDASGARVEELASRSPAVRAARAWREAARLDALAQSRLAWPQPTLKAGYSSRLRDIPEGSFSGPGAAGLAARWSDPEIAFTLGVPLPFFDRNQSEVARAAARVLAADAAVQKAEANARYALQDAAGEVESAWAALAELKDTPSVVDRELELLDKAFRAGELDALARAVALRLLQDSAARYDTAVRDYRVAVARWRRAAGPPGK